MRAFILLTLQYQQSGKANVSYFGINRRGRRVFRRGRGGKTPLRSSASSFAPSAVIIDRFLLLVRLIATPISVKHLDRYLDKYEFRFNNRHNPYLFRDTLLRLLATTNLEYKELTKKEAA
jgi:hypothetical protein